jgi:dTDP-4-dehydrorhamnose reductase
MAANATGVRHLAEACAAAGLQLVGFSSDLVFDGGKGGPYVEADAPAPLNVYGRSKAAAEAAIVGAPGGLAIRTAAFFSPRDRYNFAHHCLQALRRGERFAAAADHAVSPTYTPDLAEAALDLLIDGEAGVWHLASEGDGMTWAEFARMLARAAGFDDRLVTDADPVALGWVARRPRRAVLASERGAHMPELKDAVARFMAEARTAGEPAPRRETPATEIHRRGEILREPKSFGAQRAAV